MKKYYLPLILALLTLSGCSMFETQEVPVIEEESWPVERLYSEAKAALDAEDYQTALRYYGLLESRFPFGDYAQQGLLESSYAYYKSDDAENAIATVDRFIRVYPLNPNMDYAIYLRGLINFSRDVGIIERYIPRDETQRDPGAALLALKDFTDLVNRYPTSQYAADASQRIVYLRNRLAQHEVNVAHFYMRRGAYIAAANRGRYVIENYPRTPAMADALMIMARAYKVLELTDLSNDALKVLEHNYPDHPGIAAIKEVTVGE